MISKMPLRVAILAGLLAATPAVCAGQTSYTNEGAAGAEDNKANCEQKERAYVAFLACTKLLMSPDADTTVKIRITERRAQASLVLFYFTEAAEDFTLVIAAEPGNIDALRGRAEALYENGDFKKSADDWGMVASKLPDDIPARIHQGKNLYAAGLYEQAVAAYEAAVALDGKNAVAYIGLARAYDMQDKREKADESIAAALKLNPANSSAFMAKGEMAERRGDKQVAIDSYMASLKVNGMQVKPRHALQRLGIETPP